MSRPSGHREAQRVLLAHGGGGAETRELIEKVFLRYFKSPLVRELEDSAVLQLGEGPVAFTTDTFTVYPLFFKGGDIGKLAISGTVNDLAVMGARPEFLSVAFVIEEGFGLAELERIVESVAREAESCGVEIATGDTKVVPQGTGGGLYINTTGIGRVVCPGLSSRNLVPEKTAIIVSGPIGDHGACILASREGLEFEIDLESDCGPVWPFVREVLRRSPEVFAMRDPTRGGLSAVLNEWASASGVEILIEEKSVPVREPVLGLCELLGIDHFHLACEGRVVFAVRKDQADEMVSILRSHGLSREAAVIGYVRGRGKGRVVLKTPFGPERVLDQPSGELFPRIC
jgi:hydrogenase expression/formation protein HypE